MLRQQARKNLVEPLPAAIAGTLRAIRGFAL
jgi:hypothetical protein